MNKVLALLLGIWIFSACSSSSDSSTESASEQAVSSTTYRPTYHFSPNQNWMGEPISMVFYNNEYHLFYQFNSENTDAESNSWGHAISPDMMKWKESQPISSFEEFENGSVVSDVLSTSALGQNPLVAVVNDDDEVAIFYSNDGGTSWKEYGSNPVLEFPGTPKVTWMDETNSWLMTMTGETEVTFFSSIDLINWSQESKLSLDEPALSADLFPLSDGWGLLLYSNKGVNVLLGKFDGSSFSPTQSAKLLDLGSDNSAGTVLSSQGRSVYIGWMNNPEYSNDLPTDTWKSSFTLPRTLSLNEEGQTIGFPVSEINSMLTAKRRGKLDLLKNTSSNWYSFSTVSDSQDIEVTISNEESEKVVLKYQNSSFTLDRSKSGLTGFNSDFSKIITSKYASLSDTTQFDIFIDRSSLEVFINGGEVQISSLVFPLNAYKSVSLRVDGELKNIPATLYDVNQD